MSTYELIFDGTAADAALYDSVSLIEVEENIDMPSAMQLTTSVNRSDRGDLTLVGDARLQPFTNVALVVSADGETSQCVFDGYVLSHKLHLEAGVTSSTLQVWSQDATWMMNLEEKVKEWADVTDADVAASIFADYGITPSGDNRADNSPSHTEDKHTLMQRGSDIQFLRMLARRNGKLCRVACDDKPGLRTGFFAKPALGSAPELTIVAIDLDAPTVASLDFEWDVTRPSSVQARQALFDDAAEDGVSAEPDDSGLTPLAERGLADFAGKTMSVLLTAPVDDAGELAHRATSVLREAGWFVRCEGETDADRLKAILRAGSIVAIAAAGTLNSGNYLVWSVRHSITADSHRMKFVLVRNAVGPASMGGAS
ncbi:MAG TPA: contractile injection system protein, VgrG/Pvc8 family [Thermoanaerobaculia bacterium]|jgi:phage protein D|nr:contractile injection system protein, VgrG/Pvc8 family [Thermoanaerobaculia bacterium]